MTIPNTPHLPAVQPEAEPPALDAHGFNPDDFEWLPVARQPRSDGWKPSVQKRFIEELADTGSVTAAARAVGMSVTSCYRLRRAPGAEGFAAAWEAALAEASKRLVDIAFDRAINGTEEPVLDKHGNCIHIRQRTNDRLLMFLLRAHHPERYRHHNAPPPTPPQAAPLTQAPLTQALEALAPVTPAEPHKLMAPDALEDLLFNLAQQQPQS